MGYFLLFLLVFIGAYIISDKSRISICYALPVSINAITLILYLSGLFLNLIVGIVIVCSAIFLGVTHKVISLIKNKEKGRRDTVCNVCSFVWIILLVITYIIINHAVLYFADDFYQWGLAIKLMFYHNDFTGNNSFSIPYPSYCEFPGLVSYFACKLNGSFQDDICIMTQCGWGITLLIPLFDTFVQKKNQSAIYKVISLGCCIMISAIIMLLPLMLSDRRTVFNSLGVDSLLAIAFSYSLYLVFTNHSINKITSIHEVSFIISLISLSLIKVSGIYLALFVALLRIIYIDGRIEIRARLKYAVTLVLSCVVAYESWNLYYSMVGLVRSNVYSTQITLQNYIDFFNGRFSIVRYNVLNEGLKRLLSLNTFKIGCNKSYIVWLIISLFGIAILCCLYKVSKKKMIVYFLFLIFTEALWWAGTMYVYVFRYAEDAFNISTFDRYMSQFVVGVLFCQYGLFIRWVCNRNKESVELVGTTIFSLLLISMTYQTINNNLDFVKSNKDTKRIEMERMQDICYREGYYLDANHRVYIIAQENGPLSSYYQAVYCLAPTGVNYETAYAIPGDFHLSYCLGDPYYDNDPYTTNYSISEFSKVLENYDYLLILRSDENISSHYDSLFQNKDVHSGYYLVDKSNSRIELQPVK